MPEKRLCPHFVALLSSRWHSFPLAFGVKPYFRLVISSASHIKWFEKKKAEYSILRRILYLSARLELEEPITQIKLQ